MPHPAPDPAREAADREAFEAWCREHNYRSGPNEYPGQFSVHQMRVGWLAGAAHGRGEADRAHADRITDSEATVRRDLSTARAELARVQSDLRDARNDAESAREQAREENALRAEAESNAETLRALMRRLGDERDEYRRLYEHRGEALARPCIHCGYEPKEIEMASVDDSDRIQREHEWAHKELDKHAPTNHAMPLPARIDALVQHLKCIADAPPAALKERVVEAAMAGRPWPVMILGDWRRHNRLEDACAALAAATPKPTDAVREAAGRLRERLPDGDGRHESMHLFDERVRDLRAVMDALDAARAERKGGA